MPTVYAPVPRDATAVPAQSSDSSAALLDAEKLVCYRLAVEFQTLATRLVPRQRGVLLATLRDQLDRASVSIVLNIAEGAGRFSPPDKARFYTMARGSATECGALVDLLLVRRLITNALHAQARTLIIRIVQMLTRLSASMASRRASREEP
ncbi:MAG: four helix bundle protein [Acidobacteria bacterium]|nr:MAG: four helix bundle protein [Acidobacteriota bacterium]PYQ21977.1 MAG: four helix bundle protein [Acidobacteriota bacterium]